MAIYTRTDIQSVHVLLIVACPAIAIVYKTVPISSIYIEMHTLAKGSNIEIVCRGRMASYAICATGCCNPMRITMTFQALGRCIFCKS
jgi:hypothetical protein